MDRYTVLVIIVTIIAVIVIFYMLLYYGIIGSATATTSPTTTTSTPPTTTPTTTSTKSPTSTPPTTTPTTTSPTSTPPTTTPTTTSPTSTPPTTTPPSPPIVGVRYYYNGVMNSITLPSQAGTTIQFTQGTNLYINGNGAQPGQQIALTIYTPSGQQVYTTSTTAGSDGSFSMTVPSSNTTPNVQYKIVLSLGSNYYFYAVPVQQQTTSQYVAVTIINPSDAPQVKLQYYGQNANQTTTLQPGQSVTLNILNNTTVNVYAYAYCILTSTYVSCYNFQVTQSGTVTLDAQKLNQCVQNACIITGL